jgi:multidrug efflux pump subunit AcrA (membrane-fusion protein)
MFVRARIPEGVRQQGLLVPERGVSHDQRGEPVALVVGAGNKVEQRALQTDRVVGDQWLVVAGLKPGDRVVVSGVQKAHPGEEVTPVEAGQAATVHTAATNEPKG